MSMKTEIRKAERYVLRLETELRGRHGLRDLAPQISAIGDIERAAEAEQDSEWYIKPMLHEASPSLYRACAALGCHDWEEVAEAVYDGIEDEIDLGEYVGACEVALAIAKARLEALKKLPAGLHYDTLDAYMDGLDE